MIDPRKPNFGGIPGASWRPRPGYVAEDRLGPPAVSVVTPFHDPGEVFSQTVDCLMNQSLQYWEWIIVNDAARDVVSLRLLEALQRREPRVRVIAHQQNCGRSAARNTGFAAARTEFVYQLDQDDLLEPTTLEKSFWYLVSHPEHSFVNGWSVAFGGQRHLWSRGFELEAGFLEQNFATGRAMIRKRDFAAIGGYDESLVEGFEDWDLWLRFAERGLWGGTIPEYLDWFRRRDPPASWEAPERIAAFRETLRSRYPQLFAGAFPRTPGRARAPVPETPEELPHANRLARRLRRMLVIVPSLGMDAEGGFYLAALELLARQGWQIALAAAHEGDQDWTAALGRCSDDIHVLDRFLTPQDHPRYLRYLIESRGPDAVLVDHGEFGRAMGAYLRARCPEPRFLGFWHLDPNERPEHVQGRTPAGTRLWDLTGVSCSALRDGLLRTGAEQDRVRLLRLGVDTTVWRPRQGPRGWLRERWGAQTTDTAVLFVGRLAGGIRTDVLARTCLELSRRKLAFRAVVVGEGDDRPWLAEFVRQHSLQEHVRLEDRPLESDLLKWMAAADVFFLPSREGCSLRMLQAMACGMVVVGADVGGQAELVTPECGILVPAGDTACEVAAYVEALERLVTDPDHRLALSARARTRAVSRFGPDRIAEDLFGMLGEAERLPRDSPSGALPDLLLERAVECAELLERTVSSRRERARLDRTLEEQTELIRDLRAWIEEQLKSKAWLEEQCRNWKQAAEEQTAQLADLQAWVRQLEEARTWESDQRQRWEGIAQDCGRRLDESLRGIHELGARRDRERQHLAGRLNELARAWWPPVLRRTLRELARDLPREEPGGD